MATVKTHDLLKCNSSTQILPSVNNVGLVPFNGLLVKFNDDNSKSYRVRKNVQGRFLDGSVPTGPDEGYPSGLDIRWSVSSMKFNGIELMNATSNLRVSELDGINTFFPNYTIGNEYLYTSNVANAIIVGDSPVDTGNNQNNFYRFIESIINYYGIPVKISKSPALWWHDELFPSLSNIIIEKYFDDNFEFTFLESYIDLVDESFTSEKRRYVFNGTTVEYYLNDVLVTVAPDLPQYNDDYSFFSYNFTYDSIVEINVCPIFDPFKTSLSTDDCSNLSVNCDCSKISFSDNSNYDSNGLPGHDIDLFTSRTITLTRPNGSKFIWATDDISPRDATIQNPGNSTNSFQYNIGPNDIDGIYSIQLCSYPDWDDTILYDAYLQTIVRRNGVLYKITATNSNLDPELNLNYWQVYTCTDNCDDTRYCTTQKIVILCVSLLKCYKQLVAEAFCSIEAGICKDLCSNKKFQNAMKFRITLDQMEFSSCAGDWDAVKKQIDILNSICCCND